MTADDPHALGSLSRQELESRLEEAEETLSAIRRGDVDAVVVHGDTGQSIYTLQSADRPYRVLIEGMSEGAITLSSDGTLLYCNQRFSELVERQRESLLGEAVTSFLRDDEARRFTEQLRQPLSEGQKGEFTLYSASGAAIPVTVSLVDLVLDENLQRVICGVVTDLTNSRQRSHDLTAANQRLAQEIDERRRTEESLQQALDAAGMGNWHYLVRAAHFALTPSAERILDIGAKTVFFGLPDLLSLFVDEDQGKIESAFANAGVIGAIDLEARTAPVQGNSSRVLHFRGRASFEAEAAVRVIGVVADITDRREMEDQLRQSQKMEAVGQLTGGIAHDFNNLLMVIGGSLEILKRRVEMTQSVARLFESAELGVARGAKLNQQLLAFSRRQQLEPQLLCVDELILSFQHLLDRSLGETVRLDIQRAEDVWHCKADPHLLETAILNLAINARDAMPEGGALHLSTEARAVNAKLAAAHGVVAGDFVAVVVADTGTGMDAATMGRVFEPFFTTKDVGKGTGLGLSQVYGFAKQTGGFVTIASAIGVGTTVTLYLPRVIDEAGLMPAAVVSPPSPTQGRGRILLVEDDHEVRAVATGMLGELGYEVHEASDGPSAETLFGSLEVDMVLTDVIMPNGVSGVDLALKLRSLKPTLPILLTSGFTAQLTLKEGLPTGFPILRKPYSLASLASAVSELLPTQRGEL